MTKKLIYNLLLIVGVGLIFWLILPRIWIPEPPKQGFTNYRMVAHAMGGIDELTYTNSYDAFIVNYEKGLRVFEVDLLLSSDGELIARHEWGQAFTQMLGQQETVEEDRQGAVWSHDEFKAAKIKGNYEPLDWADIVELLERYPDVYFVTDTKQTKPEEIQKIFTQIVDQTKRRQPELLERVVPQIYNRDMWDPIQAIYPFDSVIFTLYQTQETDEQVVQFAKEKHIAAITMSETRANPVLIADLKRVGVVSYVHTINDPKIIDEFQRMGAYGFYTDFLAEEDVADHTGWFFN
ncbi:phosphatidylinositol-specific phospholipase C/glycerophosphodiester phosphodiesterase family protein [Paenibacillus sanguinis]|uniref:phosphatidylinositol-specific phospholipase C/glycerophosphodiester phosphodiesterase family protein n=1 Tax=Paenibacillus sanguinis TaxID=225906 RepID=UPI00036A7091|nr:phosphatidylinositol-specific phospholipase C/glycerophosphodiester phosphodiesterase family protein [Paenibacillus sanguinis]